MFMPGWAPEMSTFTYCRSPNWHRVLARAWPTVNNCSWVKRRAEAARLTVATWPDTSTASVSERDRVTLPPTGAVISFPGWASSNSHSVRALCREADSVAAWGTASSWVPSREGRYSITVCS